MSRAREAAYAAIVSLAAWAVLDTAARPLLRPLLFHRAHDRFFERRGDVSERYRYAPSVAWEGEIHGDLAAMTGEPALRQRRRERFVTDAWGFRNEPGPDRLAGVVLLGDSFGVGCDTSQEQTMASLLERRGHAVYNLSLPASPWQEFVNLELELPRLRLRPGATVVWLLFGGNDLDEPYGEARRLGRLERAKLACEAFLRRSPSWMLLGRVASRRAPAPVVRVDMGGARPHLFFPLYAANARRTAAQVRSHPNYSRFERTFQDMKRLAASRGLRLTVAVVPSKEEVYRWALEGGAAWSTSAAPSGFAEVVGGLCRAGGIPFLDLKAPLIAESRRLHERSKEFLWWDDDTHWGPRGHETAAAIVHDRLLRR